MQMPRERNSMHLTEHERLLRRVEELEREVERLKYGLYMAKVAALESGVPDAVRIISDTLQHRNGC